MPSGNCTVTSGAGGASCPGREGRRRASLWLNPPLASHTLSAAPPPATLLPRGGEICGHTSINPPLTLLDPCNLTQENGRRSHSSVTTSR